MSEEIKEIEVTEPKKDNSIAIREETQGLALSNHVQLTAFIKQMIEAKALPRHLKTVPEVISAWNYAAQLGLPPQPSLRNVAIIHGTPSLFGDLPLALVQRHDDFVYYEEFTIDKDYNKICYENKNLTAQIFGGVVLMQRRGMEKPQSFSFTMDDAKRAGLLGRDNVWKTYPQVMITRRARILAIRALFADALSGCSIAEDFGLAPDLKDVTPSSGETDRFNEKYGTQPETTSEIQGNEVSDMQETTM